MQICQQLAVREKAPLQERVGLTFNQLFAAVAVGAMYNDPVFVKLADSLLEIQRGWYALQRYRKILGYY